VLPHFKRSFRGFVAKHTKEETNKMAALREKKINTFSIENSSWMIL
jgi:hypothetical protein